MSDLETKEPDELRQWLEEYDVTGDVGMIRIKVTANDEDGEIVDFDEVKVKAPPGGVLVVAGVKGGVEQS